MVPLCCCRPHREPACTKYRALRPEQTPSAIHSAGTDRLSHTQVASPPCSRQAFLLGQRALRLERRPLYLRPVWVIHRSSTPESSRHWRGLCQAQTEQVWRHQGQGLAGLRGHVGMLLGTAVVTWELLELRASALLISASGMVSGCGPSELWPIRYDGALLQIWKPSMHAQGNVQWRVRILSTAVLAVASRS